MKERRRANTKGWSPRTRLEHASVNAAERLLRAVEQRHRQRHQVGQQVCSAASYQHAFNSARAKCQVREAALGFRLQVPSRGRVLCRGHLPANSNEPRMHSTTLFAACNAGYARVEHARDSLQCRAGINTQFAIARQRDLRPARRRLVLSECYTEGGRRACNHACSGIAEQHALPGHMRV